MKLDAKTILARYAEAKTLRAPYEPDWQMVARLVLPRQSNAWTNGAQQPGYAGAKDARRSQFDSTAVQALPKFATILDHIATPKTAKWHKLGPSDPVLKRNRDVQLYFDALNALLFELRYQARANFSTAQLETYMSIGAYGNGSKFIGSRRKTKQDPRPGLIYQSVPLRNSFWLMDDEGHIDTHFRRLDLNASQCRKKWPDATLPKCIQAELDKPMGPSLQRTFEICHLAGPHDDFEPGTFDLRRWAWLDVYVSVEAQEIIGEPSGFHSFPFTTPRNWTESGDIYGWSPAQEALAAIGSLNAMRKTVLKQGQRAVDPAFLAHDDGVVNGRLDLRPGAVNYGGVDANGRKLVQRVETGDFRVAEKLMEGEGQVVKDAFLVNLFQILVETPEMTATQVIERSAEKAALLAPTMGRLQHEDLGPMIEREISVLAQLGMLPEMPQVLKEAAGDYAIVYTSPMAKQMNAEEVSGFMRTVEFATQVAQATQDSGPLRRFNFDAAIPEIAETQNVPARWLHGDDEVEAMKKQDQQKQQIEQLSQAAPAIAGAAKAAATVQQAAPK
jgi:hypothetical protein